MAARLDAKPPLRAAVYGRVSRGAQQVRSSHDQVRACLPLVRQLGGTVVAVLMEAPPRRDERDRRALGELLRLARGGGMDMVVIECADRIARDRGELDAIEAELASCGVALHAVIRGGSREAPPPKSSPPPSAWATTSGPGRD